MRNKISLCFSGLLLVIAALAIGWGVHTQQSVQAKWVSLATRMPIEVDGWIGEDLPLAETEQVRDKVSEHLNYDDFVYRRYIKGAESLYIYAMFWRQGRISVREMAGHTPDGCWVANGAVHEGLSTRIPLTVAGRPTALGEVRSFRFPSAPDSVHVIWWHIWGGELVPSSFNRKSISVVIHEIWVWLWHRRGQPADQMFVRIHAFRPIEEFSNNPVVEKFVELFPSISDPVATGKP